MSKQKNSNDRKSGSIRLVPIHIPRKVVVEKLENGFLIKLKEGSDLDCKYQVEQTLIADSQKKTRQILEDFLKD